jgi:osmotically inducible protein OsmC
MRSPDAPVPTSVTRAWGSRVRIGPNDAGGYQLAVDLEVTLPHLDHGAAQSLADQAHKVCPYSNATRGNIEVTVTVSDD